MSYINIYRSNSMHVHCVLNYEIYKTKVKYLRVSRNTRVVIIYSGEVQMEEKKIIKRKWIKAQSSFITRTQKEWEKTSSLEFSRAKSGTVSLQKPHTHTHSVSASLFRITLAPIYNAIIASRQYQKLIFIFFFLFFQFELVLPTFTLCKLAYKFFKHSKTSLSPFDINFLYNEWVIIIRKKSKYFYHGNCY